MFLFQSLSVFLLFESKQNNTLLCIQNFLKLNLAKMFHFLKIFKRRQTVLSVFGSTTLLLRFIFGSVKQIEKPNISVRCTESWKPNRFQTEKPETLQQLKYEAETYKNTENN